jgi:Lar family restriction alleviation protein
VSEELKPLKPCPFCGNEAEIARGSSGWLIQCKSCCASSGSIVKDHFDDDRKIALIANWNRRTLAWIATKDTLPPHELDVLGYTPLRDDYANCITIVRLSLEDGINSPCIWNNNENEYAFEFEEITHWQPLPEAPEVNEG